MISRKVASILTALAIFVPDTTMALGQTANSDYPSKPITIVIPTGPSVSGDIIMRAYAEIVGKILGQPIVVENRPGGSGALAAAYVAANAKPDGYLLLNITIPIYRACLSR